MPSEARMTWIVRVVGWRLRVVLIVCCGSGLRFDVNSCLQVVHLRSVDVGEYKDGNIGRSICVRKLRCRQ